MPGWESRLATYLEEERYLPLVWGVNDCCQFAANIVCLITTRDYSMAVGDYGSKAEAVKILKREGGVERIADKCLGGRISPKQAQRGDVVSLRFNGRQSLGVCVGTKAAFKTDEGLGFTSIDMCNHAWRVA